MDQEERIWDGGHTSQQSIADATAAHIVGALLWSCLGGPWAFLLIQAAIILRCTAEKNSEGTTVAKPVDSEPNVD